MNSKIFKQVEQLAVDMVAAAEADDETNFYALYESLEQLCMQYQNSKQDHPVLWETLADFTEDNEKAIRYYQSAFSIADAMKDNEYKASIQFAIAQRGLEQGRIAQSKDAIKQAAKFASYTEDSELQDEIAELERQIAAR